LLEDLGVETFVAGEQLIPQTCPWLEWLENSPADDSRKSIPIISGQVSAGFRKLDAEGKTRFILLTEEEVFGEKTRSRRLQRTQVQQVAGSLDDLREGDPCGAFGLWNWTISGFTENFCRWYKQRIYAADICT
jgi:hypothetical protein